MDYRPIIFLISTVLLGGACFLLAISFTGQDRSISLRSELTESQQEQVLGALTSGVDLSDLDEIRLHLQEIDWIHRVYIARKWPNDLELDIRMEQPIAYWNDDGYINDRGEVFVTDHIVGGDLPQLYGPTGSAPRVMNEYQQLNRALFKSGRAIETLRLNDRGAWEFQDHSGIRVALGKENIRQRLQRTIDVLQEITSEESLGTPVRVDARYNNGVSIEWHEKLEIAKNFKLQRDVSL